MAKNITSYDLSPSSQLIGLFGAKTSLAIREIGCIEYDATLTANPGATKAITPFDLASYSQLVNKAGSNPTTVDLRGSAGATREWGAMEFQAGLVIIRTTKLITPFDLSGYSQIINFSRVSGTPYLPTRKDIRGIIAPFNAGFQHQASSSIPYLPTVKDSRGTSVIGSQRELGALEEDPSLAISSAFPSITEIAEKVWTKDISLLGGASYINTAGASVAAMATRTNVAQGGGASTITLDQGASQINDFYTTQYIVLIGGTGVGQSRRISGYVGSTRVATMDAAWSTAPDSSSVFAVLPFFNVATPSSIWDRALTDIVSAGSVGKLIKDYLDVAISSRLATTGYTAPPSAATIAGQVTTDHGAGSYVDSGLPSVPTAAQIADAVLDEAGAGHTGLIPTNLDAKVSLIPTNPYTGTPPTAGAIADAVLDEAAVGHTGVIPTNLDAKVSLIPTNPYTGTPPTPGAIADAVLDESGVGHTGLIAVNLDEKISVVSGEVTTAHGIGSYVDTGTNVVLTNTAIDAILDRPADGGMTLRDAIKILIAEMVGEASGGGTAVITYQNVPGNKNRVIMNVDSSGNRSSVALDLS